MDADQPNEPSSTSADSQSGGLATNGGSAPARYCSPDDDFRCMAVNEVALDLDFLCRHIVKANGRLHIQMDECCGGDCVVISQAELEALEQALEIFVRAAGETALRDGISALTRRLDAAAAD